jgi:hypothetical protein
MLAVREILDTLDRLSRYPRGDLTMTSETRLVALTLATSRVRAQLIELYIKLGGER